MGFIETLPMLSGVPIVLNPISVFNLIFISWLLLLTYKFKNKVLDNFEKLREDTLAMITKMDKAVAVNIAQLNACIKSVDEVKANQRTILETMARQHETNIRTVFRHGGARVVSTSDQGDVMPLPFAD